MKTFDQWLSEAGMIGDSYKNLQPLTAALQQLSQKVMAQGTGTPEKSQHDIAPGIEMMFMGGFDHDRIYFDKLMAVAPEKRREIGTAIVNILQSLGAKIIDASEEDRITFDLE